MTTCCKMVTTLKRLVTRRLAMGKIKILFLLLSVLLLVYIVGMMGTIFCSVSVLLNTAMLNGSVPRYLFDISASWRINGIFIRGDPASFTNYKRTNSCIRCFEHNFEYLIKNEQICKQHYPEQRIDLLIIVFTIHDHWRTRHALRSSWLSLSKNNTSNVRHVFLLGDVKSERQLNAINKENRLYHDIIMENFLDSYMNLTYKTIMGLKFAALNCSHASYVLKADDDVFVNTANVLRLLQTSGAQLRHVVGGACVKREHPVRDKYSKWYASDDTYPGAHYPDFCSGTAYVTSMDVARAIYDVSPDVPYFHLEDVYVGICREKLGFRAKKLQGFNIDDKIFDLCDYKQTFVFTVHRISPAKMYSIWNAKC